MILGGLGFLVAGLAVYFRGYSSGRDAVEKAQQEAVDLINKQVKTGEAQNQQVDIQREKDAQAVNNSGDVKSLIQLWDELNQKDSDH